MALTSKKTEHIDISISRRNWPRFFLISVLLGLIGFPVFIFGGLFLAEYHVRRAKEAIGARDFTRARAHLEQGLWYRPNSIEALYLTARTARRDRDYKKAKEFLTAYKAKGGIPDAQKLEEDLALAQSGQLGLVEKKLLVFISVNHEDSPFVLEALAQGYMYNGRWAEAIHCLNRLMEYWPEDYAVHVWRAWVFESLLQPARAEKELRQALDLRPDLDDTRLRLAEVLVLEQQYEPASLELEILKKKLPEDEVVALLMAKCCSERNRFDEAKDLLLPLLEKKPKDAAVLKEMGNVALKQAHWLEAEKWLRQCLKGTPRDLQANLFLQQCLHQLGNDAEAEKLQNQIDEIQKDRRRLDQLLLEIMATKDSIPIRLEASRILLRSDQELEGVKLLEGILQEDPTNTEACGFLADHFQAKGDKALAEAYRRRARGSRSGTTGSGSR
jgi:Tfp pilus assembly protein PilF